MNLASAYVQVGKKPCLLLQDCSVNPGFSFLGVYNYLPQTGWQKATEIYSFTVLVSKKSKIKLSSSHGPLKVPGKTLLLPLPSFWWLLAIFGMSLLAIASPDLCLCLPTAIVSLCVSVALFSLFKRIPVIELGPTLSEVFEPK